MKLQKKIQSHFLTKRLTELITPHTLVSAERLNNLFTLARRIEDEGVAGDVIECGVYNGGTAALLARFATRSKMDRTVWLFDSFQGMPETTASDGAEAKDYVGQVLGNVELVRKLVEQSGADMSRVRIMEGWFQDTFPKTSIAEIALLNIDADWYESVKLCLETFYDRITPGGFVSIDDYGHWPGCRKAVDEFLAARQLPYKLQEVDYTGRWFQKL